MQLFDKEDDDEWCDEEFLQLEEQEETGEESEDTKQYLDENVTGIEGATPTPKRRRETRDTGHYTSIFRYARSFTGPKSKR